MIGGIFFDQPIKKGERMYNIWKITNCPGDGYTNGHFLDCPYKTLYDYSYRFR